MRTAVAVVLTLFALLFGYMAMTVPMVEADGPAILFVACSAAAFFAWRWRRKDRVTA